MLKKIIVAMFLMISLTRCGNLITEEMTITDMDCDLNCKTVYTIVDDKITKKQYFINGVEVTERQYWDEHRALWKSQED